MNARSRDSIRKIAGAPLAVALAASGLLAVLPLGARAEPHHDVAVHGMHGGGEHYQHFDNHYGHNQYYPRPGYAVRAVAGERVVVEHGGERYYYAGGVWYRPWGPRFVVVAPPIGVFVPILPPFYTTVWFGGFPYYYANDTYYAWRESSGEYEVVAPPSDEASASTAAPAGDESYVYPRNGQTDEQQSKDRYECHRWAVSQSGFDPTQAGGGVPADQAGARRSDYQRAFGACLDGRGYSVK